ncbi:MAG TPA: hypothetical protein VFY44_12170, partial [Thermoleophilaceae bacterium]|nr:hypothetical protein [Thermoleophilaceae bacterium]
AGSGRVLPLGLSRADVAALVAVLSIGLTLAAARRGGGRTLERALALLALVLLLRCALDPAVLQYYTVGPMLALLCWEVAARPGLPVFALLYALSSWAVYGPLLSGNSDALVSAAQVALIALFASLMAGAAFGRAPVASRA